MNPPNHQNASEETVHKYNSEVNSIKEDLKAKAIIITNKLNSIPNVKCQEIEGAMYAFPRIFFPQKFVDLAKNRNIEPDLIFCLEMLEQTGVVCVPGSGKLSLN